MYVFALPVDPLYHLGPALPDKATQQWNHTPPHLRKRPSPNRRSQKEDRPIGHREATGGGRTIALRTLIFDMPFVSYLIG